MTGSGYQVELFDSPPPRSEWDRLDAGHRRLAESFVAGFNALEHGLSVERLQGHRNKQPILSVRLDQSSYQPVLRLNETPVGERRRELEEASAKYCEGREKIFTDLVARHRGDCAIRDALIAINGRYDLVFALDLKTCEG